MRIIYNNKFLIYKNNVFLLILNIQKKNTKENGNKYLKFLSIFKGRLNYKNENEITNNKIKIIILI